MEEVKQHWYSNLPKWIKVILLILSLVTVVYWVGRLVVLILEAFRTLLELVFIYLGMALLWVSENFFERKNFYTGIAWVFIAVVGCVLICEFVFDLGIFEKVANWALDVWEMFRQWCTNLIMGGA